MSGLGSAIKGRQPATPLAENILQIPNVYAQDYQSYLPPKREEEFRNWVKTNRIPFDPNDRKSDYDMRAYWLALLANDPITKRELNASDNTMHFTDKFKTPYHQSFSSESVYANKDTPSWNDKSQLVDRLGRIWFDESRR